MALAAKPTTVTVLMPVYNGGRYLAQAIESILAQTHRDFEFLILDDGSTDETPEILARYAALDPRIRTLRHPNMDQPRTLNRGLELSRNDWVAIIDHDDVSLPRRLELQLEALAREPQARVIGTWATEINAEGRAIRERGRGPLSVDEFRRLRNAGGRVPLVHASVLLHRPSILALGGYDPAFGAAADTELWTRVAEHHPIIVVPEPLTFYRIHRSSMSFRRLFEQREMLRWIEARARARGCGDPPPSLESFRTGRAPGTARWWLELRQDLFWYFRSHALLAAAEKNRRIAASCATVAALVAPGNALRFGRRQLLRRGRDAA